MTMADMNHLSDEELKHVSGGMLFDATGKEECDPQNPWEVLNNDNCSIIARFPNRKAAADWVTSKFGTYSYNAQVVDWDTVQRLRKNPNTY